MPIIKRWNKSAKNSFCHFGFRRNNRIFALPNRCVGRVVRRRSAKPVTVVRFRYAPQKPPFSDAERGFAILDITIIVADLRDRGYDAELLVEEDDDVPLAKQTFSLMIWPGLP